MDTFDKIKILGQAASYDVCMSSCFDKGRTRDPQDPIRRWIYPACLPNGRTMPILKILLSNQCENNCYYCVNRAGNHFSRISFQPEELAQSFMNLFRKRLVHGLFLSSGINWGTKATTEKMIKTVEILRRRYLFNGYIHLKILPGADNSSIERAMQLADRISINLESPTQEHLNKIAPGKNMDLDLVSSLKKMGNFLWKQNIRAKSFTTQFIVGASDEKDKELLSAASGLYKETKLWRAYFSAFQPAKGTPLENHPGVPLIREHRLYQADYLLRQYGFSFEELIFNDKGFLPMNSDPKMLWAIKSTDKFPIEINKASKEELLRIPGIGPLSAGRILKQREKEKIKTLKELKSTGAVIKRAEPFILINGKKQSRDKDYTQLNLSF